MGPGRGFEDHTHRQIDKIEKFDKITGNQAERGSYSPHILDYTQHTFCNFVNFVNFVNSGRHDKIDKITHRTISYGPNYNQIDKIDKITGKITRINRGVP